MTAHTQITADPLEAIRATLAGHRIALTAMLEANRRANVTRMARFILDGLDEQARKFLAVIAKLEREPMEGPYGSLGHLGLYGGAEAIADIIRQSEQQRHSRREAA